VDFVERGFRRFCSQNRAVDAKRVWVGDMRITDSLFDLTEQARNQVEAEREGMTDHLYLVGDYEAAASIPVGATLARLEANHHLLPAAFYAVLTTNLYKWMRVYDYLDAQEHAEIWQNCGNCLNGRPEWTRTIDLLRVRVRSTHTPNNFHILHETAKPL
jgi:hypothetical protein